MNPLKPSPEFRLICAIGSINSHYFHIMGDKLINQIGVKKKPLGGVLLEFHDMGVSKNRGTSKSAILIGFSMIFTIHFGVPLLLETPVCFFTY